jgi:hypothetical protein
MQRKLYLFKNHLFVFLVPYICPKIQRLILLLAFSIPLQAVPQTLPSLSSSLNITLEF